MTGEAHRGTRLVACDSRKLDGGIFADQAMKKLAQISW
jgi:hypothetical protein